MDQPAQASLFATEVDASPIAALRTAAGAHLTRTFGQGHWSHIVTERAVHSVLKTSRVLVVRRGPSIVATMTLATTKPWAIDLAYFTAVPRPSDSMPMMRRLAPVGSTPRAASAKSAV